MDNDIPKYRKKSKKKYKTRADHKHEYIRKVGIRSDYTIPILLDQCIICGYTKQIELLFDKESGYYKPADINELAKQYEIVDIDSL